jgi:glycosyltransferase involved in cell wall biosynthesis
MKALLFTNHFPSATARTRGVYNEQTFGALAKNCEIRVVGPIPWWSRRDQPRAMLFGEKDRVTGLSASFPSFWSVPGATPMHAAAVFASLHREVRRLRREFPFDAVLATWAYPDIVAGAMFAREAKRPLIATVLGSDVNEQPKHRLLRPQIRWALRSAARVVAVSRALGEACVDLGVDRARLVVQHNGVDGTEFRLRDKAAARKDLGIKHARPIVLYVGNVKPEKGCDVLIEAADKLVRIEGRRDVDVVLVGSGELDAELRARVAAIGLEKNVTFAGRRLHSEIPTWLAASDLLCLPSRREGCPNVILEALASGRPIVASNVGGVPELVRDGENGLLPPAADSDALSRALASALDKTWSPEALRCTVENLSWDGVAATYRRLLDEVTQEAAAAP